MGRWMDGQMGGQTDTWVGEWMDGWIMDEKMERWKEGQNGWVDVEMERGIRD